MNKDINEFINAINNLGDFSNNITITKLSYFTRYLLEYAETESNLLINKNQRQWQILHTWIHYNTSDATIETVLEACAKYLYKLNDEIFSGKLKIVLTKLRKILINVDEEYWSFQKSKNSKEIAKVVRVFKCTLINFAKEIYLIVAFNKNAEGGVSSKKYTFFSKNEMHSGFEYNIQYSIRKNSLGHRRNLITGNSIVEDKLKFFKNYFGEKIFNKIQKLYNDSISKEEVLPIYIDKNDLWEGLFEIIPYSGHIISNNSSRNYANIILGLQTNSDTKRNEIAKVMMRDNWGHYPWAQQPLINSTATGKIPFYRMKKLIDYLQKITGNDYDKKYYSYLVKEHLDSKELLACKSTEKKEELWLETDKIYGAFEKNSILTNYNYFSLLSFFKNLFKKNNEVDEFNGIKIRKMFAIMAPAGHGKSTFAKKYIKEKAHTDFLVLTPTWKAREVYDPLSKEVNNLKTMNIQKFNKKNQFEKDEYKNHHIIFDEISMYGDKEWEMIASLNIYRAFFIGDFRQLKPIYHPSRAKYIHFFAKKNKSLLDDFKENWRLNKDSESYEANLELISILASKGKIDLKNGKYKKLFTTYNTYTDMFKVLNDKLKEFGKNGTRIIVSRNTGIISVDNLNRILLKRNIEEEFKEGDDVIITNRDSTHPLYPGRALTISKISTNEGRVQYSFKNITKTITLYENEANIFSHNLALTAHKAQGQNIENVIIIISKEGYENAEWLYTAASRTKSKLHIIAPSDFEMDIDMTYNIDEDSCNKIFMKETAQNN